MRRPANFPNDKRVSVIRKDLTQYRAWESYVLMNTHGWTESEVLSVQNLRVNP